MKGMFGIVGLVLLVVTFIFIIGFSVAGMGELDRNANVTPAYYGVYNTSVNTSVTAIVVLQFVPMLLAVFVVVGVLVLALVMAKKW